MELETKPSASFLLLMKCLICFSINEDPAPGPTGVLLPHEKDLTQVHHHLLRGTEREVVLDLLHLVIGKKRRTRSRSPESQVIGENTKQP